MMVLKTFLIASSLLLLTNCVKPEPLEIYTAPVEIEIIKPIEPVPVSLEDITWVIVEESGYIYYAITIDDYQILSQNMLEIKRYIVELIGIKKYYELVNNL